MGEVHLLGTHGARLRATLRAQIWGKYNRISGSGDPGGNQVAIIHLSTSLRFAKRTTNDTYAPEEATERAAWDYNHRNEALG